MPVNTCWQIEWNNRSGIWSIRRIWRLLTETFASKSAHISGTLTAGDENGFAATFYAGKFIGMYSLIL